MTRTNEKRETLIAFKNIDVKIKYFCRDRGRLVTWKDLSGLSTEYQNVKVRIDRYSYIERASLVRKKDFDIKQLIIKERPIPGDVVDMDIQFGPDGKIILSCKVVI